MTNPLSLPAQAVLDACDQAFDQCGTTAQGLAAALRAAAGQLDHSISQHRLFAIAAELEANR
jgi:hypothetical protein